MSSTSSSSKGINWSDDELRALLVLWAQPEAQASLNGIHRNKTVFESLSAALAKEGFVRRCGTACRDKINRIRAQYRTIIDQKNRSGGGREDDDPFWFPIIDGVLAKNPSTNPIASLDSSLGLGADDEAEVDPAQADALVNDGDDFDVDVHDEVVSHHNDTPLFEDSAADGSFDDDIASIQSNVTAGQADLETADTDEQDDRVMPEDKKKDKKAPKRKAEKVSGASKLHAVLDSSYKEMRKDVREQEERQRKADEEIMERDWQRRMTVEDQRRREDREFKMAMMAMMERQNNLLERMINLPSHPSQSYGMQVQQPHFQPYQAHPFPPQGPREPHQPNHRQEPHQQHHRQEPHQQHHRQEPHQHHHHQEPHQHHHRPEPHQHRQEPHQQHQEAHQQRQEPHQQRQEAHQQHHRQEPHQQHHRQEPHQQRQEPPQQHHGQKPHQQHQRQEPHHQQHRQEPHQQRQEPHQPQRENGDYIHL